MHASMVLTLYTSASNVVSSQSVDSRVSRTAAQYVGTGPAYASDDGEVCSPLLATADDHVVQNVQRQHGGYTRHCYKKTCCVYRQSAHRKVTRRLSTDSGIDNSTYLRMRASKLNEFQRKVVLIIDEIYIARRVEYSGGEITGLTPDGCVATTLLCFIVKSLTSKFQDIVAVFPMNKLSPRSHLSSRAIHKKQHAVSTRQVSGSARNKVGRTNDDGPAITWPVNTRSANLTLMTERRTRRADLADGRHVT